MTHRVVGAAVVVVAVAALIVAAGARAATVPWTPENLSHEPDKPGSITYVQASSANLRARESTDSPIVHMVRIGTPCEVYSVPGWPQSKKLPAFIMVRCERLVGYLATSVLAATKPAANALRARAKDASLPPKERESAALRLVALVDKPLEADRALLKQRFQESALADLREARAHGKTKSQTKVPLQSDAVVDGTDFVIVSFDADGKMRTKLGSVVDKSLVVEVENVADVDRALFIAFQGREPPRPTVAPAKGKRAEEERAKEKAQRKVEHVDDYAKSCVFRPTVETQLDMGRAPEVVAECWSTGFTQVCGPDQAGCFADNNGCRQACGDPCTTCEDRCASTCDGCHGACKPGDGGGCAKACAQTRATCEIDCLAELAGCRGACGEEETTCMHTYEQQKARLCPAPDCAAYADCMFNARGANGACRELAKKLAPECLTWCQEE